VFLIAIIIIILLALIGIVMLVPFHIFFDLSFHDMKLVGNFQLKWMGIKVVSRKIPSEEPPKKKEKKEPETEEKKEEKKSKGFKLDEVKEFLHLGWKALPHLKPILTGFIDSINLENLVLRVKMGFESSVDTEFLMGCLWAVAALLKPVPNLQLEVIPLPDGKGVSGDCNAHISLRLSRITYEILRALSHKPVRSMLIYILRRRSSKNSGGTSDDGIFKGLKKNSGSSNP
jgi:hypothetical protein